MSDVPAFDLPDDVVRAILQVAEGKERVLIAIAGPPGAGKSTFADALAARLDDAFVLPMDGFHFDNDVLTDMGLLDRKGAPQTFDVAALDRVLRAVRAGGGVSVPTFDRDADRVVPDGRVIPADARIILVEGNYLLLDAPGWRALQPMWDLRISITVPMAVLEDRLCQRWLDQGLSKTQASARVHHNDLPNARSITEHALPCDVVFRQ